MAAGMGVLFILISLGMRDVREQVGQIGARGGHPVLLDRPSTAGRQGDERRGRNPGRAEGTRGVRTRSNAARLASGTGVRSGSEILHGPAPPLRHELRILDEQHPITGPASGHLERHQDKRAKPSSVVLSGWCATAQSGSSGMANQPRCCRRREVLCRCSCRSRCDHGSGGRSRFEDRADLDGAVGTIRGVGVQPGAPHLALRGASEVDGELVEGVPARDVVVHTDEDAPRPPAVGRSGAWGCGKPILAPRQLR
jgi:hypothetical protein